MSNLPILSFDGFCPEIVLPFFSIPSDLCALNQVIN